MKGGRTALAVAVALLAALPALPATAAASPSVPGLPSGLTLQQLPWWNVTSTGNGLHLRVLVQVTNTLPYPVTDGAVAAELDLARLLRDAGWPSLQAPGQIQLKGFQLDPNSLRVVPLNDLDGSPTVRGTPKTADPGILPPDPRRFEQPSAHVEGSLMGTLAAPFDPRTNPYVTVVWRVSGALASGASRPFMVYLDTLANGQMQPPSYTRPGPGSALQALFWSSPGLTLYGTVPASAAVGSVTVAGLHPRTNVSVWSAPASGPTAGLFSRVKQPPGFPQPATGAPEGTFVLGADSSEQAFIAANEARLFRLDADRPILGFGTSTGFVPSIEGSAIGTEFVFALTRPAMWEQDTVYFIDPTGTPQRTDPTTVQVQRMEDGKPTGAPLSFFIGSHGNPWPYTRGARAGGFEDTGNNPSACQPTPPGDGSGFAPLLQLDPGLYRARVQPGGKPVLLQLQSMGGMVQVPSLSGAPEGTAFEAVTGWSDFTQFRFDFSQCVEKHRRGGFVASAVGGDSAIAVTSWEEPNQVQIFPPGVVGDPNPKNAFPDPRDLPQAPEVSETFSATRVLDRPIQFKATSAPIRLFAGPSPPITDVVPLQNQGPGFGVPVFGSGTMVNGPLWGTDLARTFVGLGATQVVAPFPATRVTANLRYLDGSASTQVSTLAAGGLATLPDRSPSNPLVSFLLEASKPVFAYPSGTLPGTLAGVPPFLSATALGADFRGPLVRIATEDGQEPAAGSAPAGTPFTYKLLVTNLGRGINGADLPDDIQVTLAGVGRDWAASLDGGQASTTLTQMSSGETRSVELTVKGASSLPQGAASTLLVKAVSGTNPKVEDQVEVATSIKSSYAVGLWFDTPRNPLHRKEVVVPPGTPADFRVIVENMGSVPDTIKVTLTDPRSPWTATATLEDGSPLPTDGLWLPPPDPLRPKESQATLFVRMARPTAQDDRSKLADITILATSVGSSSKTANLVATAKVDTPSEVQILIPVTALRVAPGATASFPFKVTSTGSTSLNFRLESDAPAGWAAPRLLWHAAGHARAVNATDSITPLPTEPLNLEATLAVPANETANRLAVLHLVATEEPKAGGSGGVSLERFLYVTVAARHQLDVPLSGPAAAPAGGGNLTVDLAVGNRGNLNESLKPVVGDLPTQWGIALPKLVVVARGGFASFPVTVEVPAAARPELYNVTLRLLSEDGNATHVPLQVQVGSVGAADVGAAAAVLAQPGSIAQAVFPVRNRGNTPLVVSVVAATGERWILAEKPPPFQLGPGAVATVRVAWAVPRGEAEGNSTHQAQLVLTPSDPSATASHEALSTQVAVGRSDLRLAGVQAFPGAAGTLVSVQVANGGNRAASNVVVQLQSRGLTLDNVTIGELPAGATSNVTLLLPRGQETDGVQVALDPQDLVVERDEGNNLAPLAQEGTAAPAPLPPAVAFLAVLAAVAAARRRRA